MKKKIDATYEKYLENFHDLLERFGIPIDVVNRYGKAALLKDICLRQGDITKAEDYDQMLKAFKEEVPHLREVSIFYICYASTLFHFFENDRPKADTSTLWEQLVTIAQVMGIIHGSIVSNTDDLQSILKNFSTDRAKKASNVRHAPMKVVRSYAIELFKEKSWTSHKASHEIKEKVMKKAESLGKKMSDARAQKTIYDWLRDYEKDPAN